MIIYDEYGDKSYFFFGELSPREKYQILKRDYEEEVQKEIEERRAADEYEYQNHAA